MTDRAILGLTPTQTVGPFFRHGLAWAEGQVVADDTARGEHIRIVGRIIDGDGLPVPDGFVELWQADADGRYDHPDDQQNNLLNAGFDGFGRIPTDRDGRFEVITIKPGTVPATDGSLQAPHLLVSLFARGLLDRLVTRIYFADDPMTADDPVLGLVSEERRRTLLARPVESGVYRFDIVLQGQGETVFFDV